MPQRFVYNTSRLVFTQNHPIFIAKIFVFKVPPQKYVGQWLSNVLYQNIFQRIPERVKRFRQNGCCCNCSDHTGVENSARIRHGRRSRWPYLYCSVHLMQRLRFSEWLFSTWIYFSEMKRRRISYLVEIVSLNSITILFNLRMREITDAGLRKLHRPVKNSLLMEVMFKYRIR